MKILLFDSSTLITLVMSGMESTLKELKGSCKCEYIIPNSVKKEIIDRPLEIKRYELDALKLQKLIDEGILDLPESLGVNRSEVEQKTKQILNKANHSFFSGKEPINLIQEGEAAVLALAEILNAQKIKNLLCVDERTTRMMFEKPENLKKLLQKKLHTNIILKKDEIPKINAKFIRSTELVYVAYKKGMIKYRNPNNNKKQILSALLWATKLKGAAISPDEIKEITRIG